MNLLSTWKRGVVSAGMGLCTTLVLLMTANLADSALAAPPPQGGFGTVKGRLVWNDAKAPEPKEQYKKGDPKILNPEVCGGPIFSRDVVVDPASKGIESGIAYLVKPNGANPDLEKALLENHAKVEIDQKACQFVPYSTAMHQGQTLVFKSSDPVNHNVRYFGFANAPYNKILPPNKTDEVKLVAERRPIGLACDVHPWMKGYIMVFDHPFFAVTKPDGSFEIQGVPAGSQKLVVWQGAVGYVTPGAGTGMAGTIKPGQTTDVGDVKLDPAKVK